MLRGRAPGGPEPYRLARGAVTGWVGAGPGTGEGAPEGPLTTATWTVVAANQALTKSTTYTSGPAKLLSGATAPAFRVRLEYA